MADTVDQILKSLDIDSIDPTLILSSIVSQNEKLSSTIIKSMEKSVLASTQSITKGYKDIEKGLSDLGKQISKKSKNFSIRDILTDNENLKKASDSKHLNIVNNALDSVKSAPSSPPLPNRMESNLLETKTPPKIPGVPPSLPTKPKEELKTERSFFDEGTQISGFSDNAIEQLENIFNSIQTTQTGDARSRTPATTGEKMPGWLKSLALAGAAILGGAIGVGAMSLFSDGPLKGVGKIISRIGVSAGVGILKIFKKFVPNWMKETVGTIAKSIKGVFVDFASLIKKQLLGIGAKAGKVVGKVGGVALIKKAFAPIVKLFGKVFAKSALKKIPFGVGAIFGLAFGISRMIKGDITGGLLEFLSGLVSIVPGIGTVASFAIDAYLAVRDIKQAKETPVEPTGGPSMFEVIKEKVVSAFQAVPWRNTPLIGGMIRLKEAYDSFASGAPLGESLKLLGKGLLYLTPIGGVLHFFSNLYEELLNPSPEPAEGEKQSFIAMLAEKIRTGFSTIKTKLMKWLHSLLPGALKSVLQIDDNGEFVINKNLLGDLKNKIKEIPGANLVAKGLAKVKDKISDVKENYEDSMQEKSKSAAMATQYSPYAPSPSKPPKAENQDFIWRPGQGIESFSSKDILIGSKSDGAFAQAFTDLNNNILTLINTIGESAGDKGSQGDNIVVNNVSTDTGNQYPEDAPAFQKPNDVIVERANFWRANYGYIMPS